MPQNPLLILSSLSLCIVACGPLPDQAEEAPVVSRQQGLSGSWRPFTSSSPWNTRLSSSRRESALSSRVMGTGPMGFSDGDYGIGFFAAEDSSPTWSIEYDGYNNGSSYDAGGTLRLRGPSNMRAASGSDASVILVDEDQRYAYEMWNFSREGSLRASAAYVVRVDLSSNGVREGITGGGVPAIGGVLRDAELASGSPIRHKLWVAAHPDIVYERHDWPALRHDVRSDGRYATLDYGDVVALTKDYSFDDNPCGLSPFMRRLARALQEYGGIVVDKGGDSLGFPAEVDAIRDNIDIDYDVEMWHQLSCLKRYMVKVSNPW
jgi:hypothetical protein